MRLLNTTRLLYVLSAMCFLTNGDIYSSAPLLVSIGNDLQVSISSAALSVTSYMAAFGFFNLFFGTMGDRFGRTRIILLSSFGTSICSCLCVLAQTLPILILLRALNGAFAAGIMPISIAIIGEFFDDDSQRTKAIASMIGIMILGGASATFIGGSLSFFLSWKSVYLIYGLSELIISFFLILILEKENGTVKELNVIQMYTDVLNNKDVLACLLLVFMSGIIVFGSFSFSGELIRTATHLNLLKIGILLSFFGIGGIASSKIAKYIHSFRITTICLAAGAAGSISIYFLSFASMAAVFAAALFIWGMSFITIHSNYVSTAQNLIPELRGTVMAMLSFSMLAGGTVGTLINKKIIELYCINHIYIHTAVLFGVLAVLAAIILNRINRKKKHTSLKAIQVKTI